MLERLRQPITFKRPGRGRSASDDPPAAGEPPGAPEAALPVADPDAPPAPAEPIDHGQHPAGQAKRRSRAGGNEPTVVGLAIEPGLIVAAKSHLDGRVVVDRAAYAPIGIDVVRDGEVNDVPALVEALSELFRSSKLDRRVRIGIANQRIMMRRLELPPLTDETEIQQAVLFQAQDEIPMPLDSVVLDHQSLGIDTGPNGDRLQVLLVAARRDMVERVLQAARLAGLQPEGVDLAAFGMIRALRPLDADPDEQILYLSIGGLTNLAISRGPVCEFTRVIPWGVEQIAGDVASRCAIPIDDARRLLVATGVAPPAAAVAAAPTPTPRPPQPPGGFPGLEERFAGPDAPQSTSVPVDAERATVSFGRPSPPTPPPVDPTDLLTGPPAPTIDPAQVVNTALNDGIRRIAAEVRHSIDFYLAGRQDGPLTRALLCGPALEIPGFADGLSRELGITVRRGEVALASPNAAGDVPRSILAVAAGLSVPEGPA